MHDEGASRESCEKVWSTSAIGYAIHALKSDMDFTVKVRWIFVQPPSKEQGSSANSAPRATSDASPEKSRYSKSEHGLRDDAMCPEADQLSSAQSAWLP